MKGRRIPEQLPKKSRRKPEKTRFRTKTSPEDLSKVSQTRWLLRRVEFLPPQVRNEILPFNKIRISLQTIIALLQTSWRIAIIQADFMKKLIGLAPLFYFLFPLGICAQPSHPRHRDVNLIPMDKERTLSHQTILIQDRITISYERPGIKQFPRKNDRAGRSPNCHIHGRNPIYTWAYKILREG